MAGNPLTDDVETNIENPGIESPTPPYPSGQSDPTGHTHAPDKRLPGRNDSIESPGGEDEVALEREEDDVDRDDPL